MKIKFMLIGILFFLIGCTSYEVVENRKYVSEEVLLECISNSDGERALKSTLRTEEYGELRSPLLELKNDKWQFQIIKWDVQKDADIPNIDDRAIDEFLKLPEGGGVFFCCKEINHKLEGCWMIINGTKIQLYSFTFDLETGSVQSYRKGFD